MSVYKIFILLVFNRECRNFCLANHACVSHLLRGQPHLLECYYRNCLIGTHICVHPVSEWSVFSTFSVNSSQVAMFQIMPALCVHRGRGKGGQPNVDRSGQGGFQKFPNLCRHPLWMTPMTTRKKKCLWYNRNKTKIYYSTFWLTLKLATQ